MASRRSRSVRSRGPGRQAASPSTRRSRLALLMALLTMSCVVAILLFASGKQFLMPGPLASAHVAIDNCSSCHTNSGGGQMNWLHGLVAAASLSDSKACLSCHKMANTAFNPHGVPASELNQRTERLVKTAAQTWAPWSSRVQKALFPPNKMLSRGLNCASCHQEHKGANFNLKEVSDAQCRTCHVVKFDSFDGSHPAFSNYPFERRTRIIYDHASHFNKHYPELAKKNPSKRYPATCSTCHDSSKDKHVMSVAPFEKACASCHLDQITGKDRVSGPKGVAFLALPGLDLDTLRQKNAPIGEWPENSEAELTPFMTVMIGRNERGRSLIKAVSGLDLQDLSNANDAQIKAVTSMVWEIKGLFYNLIKAKASDVLADLTIGKEGRLSRTLISELTASIPRDVVVRAHQSWLPNLAVEMANGPGSAGVQNGAKASAAVTPQAAAPAAPAAAPATPAAAPAAPAAAVPTEPESEPAQEAPSADPKVASRDEPAIIKENPQACVFSLFGQCLVKQDNNSTATGGSAPSFLGGNTTLPPRTSKPEKGLGRTIAIEQPRQLEAVRVAQASGQSNAIGNKQKDALLFPRPDEIRALGARAKEIGQPGQPVQLPPGSVPPPAPQGGATPANPTPPAAVAAAAPPAPANPAPTPAAPAPAAAAGAPEIQSDVEPENWAEYGGWYQQDYAVFYRPKGHKDRFIFSWLALTGPHAQPGTASPAAAVFGYLTNKDAQGSCSKCHSVDAYQGNGRVVNFSPPSAKTKQGSFTSFVHEPHFSIMDNRGCLTCHNLEKGNAYLESFKQANPLSFVSNFSAVKKDLCESCHTSNKARQDCLLCHKYHVDGVITPTMNTKTPVQ